MTTLANARLGDSLVNIDLEDGVISAISPANGGRVHASGETIDLEGRWVLPGLWDHHVHVNQQALAVRRIDLAGAESAAEAAQIMAQHASRSRLQASHPIMGHGFRDGLWLDTPTAKMLDDVLGAVPAVLISGDLHCAWLNTAALAMFGHAGHPTGVLREDPCFALMNRLQDIPDDTLDEWVVDAASEAATRGVVGVVDMEMGPNIASWQRRAASGFSTLRVQAGIYTSHLDEAISAGLRTGTPVLDPAFGGSPLLTVGPFKILTDGSLNTRTAYCVEEYHDTQDRGLLTVSTDELVPLITKASAAGIQPAVHAIGDEANRLALDAFETVGCRGRVEHAQLLRIEDIPRFAALGVAASVQPEHAMDDRDVAERFWPGRTDRAFLLRSLLDTGAELLLGSDAPVSPLDPWVTISAAVSRSRDGREPWHPEQSITVMEALAASTHSTVAVGQPADLIAVDRDPFTASGEELRTMVVSLTVLAGTITHSTVEPPVEG